MIFISSRVQKHISDTQIDVEALKLALKKANGFKKAN